MLTNYKLKKINRTLFALLLPELKEVKSRETGFIYSDRRKTLHVATVLNETDKKLKWKDFVTYILFPIMFQLKKEIKFYVNPVKKNCDFDVFTDDSEKAISKQNNVTVHTFITYDLQLEEDVLSFYISYLYK